MLQRERDRERERCAKQYLRTDMTRITTRHVGKKSENQRKLLQDQSKKLYLQNFLLRRINQSKIYMDTHFYNSEDTFCKDISK